MESVFPSPSALRFPSSIFTPHSSLLCLMRGKPKLTGFVKDECPAPDALPVPLSSFLCLLSGVFIPLSTPFLRLRLTSFALHLHSSIFIPRSSLLHPPCSILYL